MTTPTFPPALTRDGGEPAVTNTHHDEDPMSRDCAECTAEAGEPCRPWCVAASQQLDELD